MPTRPSVLVQVLGRLTSLQIIAVLQTEVIVRPYEGELALTAFPISVSTMSARLADLVTRRKPQQPWLIAPHCAAQVAASMCYDAALGYKQVLSSDRD